MHFRSLVTSSTDLVLVFGRGVGVYVSQSVTSMLGRRDSELLGSGFMQFVHENDRTAVEEAQSRGEPREMVFRLKNANDEWRHLEAHLTDLRTDRHLRGIVLNARDITERVELEQELTRQAQRDSFGSQLVEALEMADEEAPPTTWSSAPWSKCLRARRWSSCSPTRAAPTSNALR